jgi:pimeloyl-ACP methyl ester carboxylesterase
MRAADLPGLGSVPARPDVCSYDDLAAYLAPTIMDPAVLVAQSMARVALQLALQTRCDYASVLVAATGGIDARVTAPPTGEAQRRRSRGRRRGHQGGSGSRRPSSEISVPVLLIWATDDPWSPLSAAKALCRTFRSASLVTFASDDHWVAQSSDIETARAIQSFLEA